MAVYWTRSSLAQRPCPLSWLSSEHAQALHSPCPLSWLSSENAQALHRPCPLSWLSTEHAQALHSPCPLSWLSTEHAQALHRPCPLSWLSTEHAQALHRPCPLSWLSTEHAQALHSPCPLSWLSTEHAQALHRPCPLSWLSTEHAQALHKDPAPTAWWKEHLHTSRRCIGGATSSTGGRTAVASLAGYCLSWGAILNTESTTQSERSTMTIIHQIHNACTSTGQLAVHTHKSHACTHIHRQAVTWKCTHTWTCMCPHR